MTKKLLFIGLILALAVAAVAADAITGKWVFEQPAFGRGGGPGGGGPGGGAGGPGGAPGGGNMPPRTVTLDLKAEGANLTGTILMPAFGRGGGGGEAPAPTPIKNGKVDGNNISFDVTRESPMGSMTTKYTGTVSGAEMKLKSTMENPQGGDPIVREVVAKKQ